jgi:hypothetical protein
MVQQRMYVLSCNGDALRLRLHVALVAVNSLSLHVSVAVDASGGMGALPGIASARDHGSAAVAACAPPGERFGLRALPTTLVQPGQCCHVGWQQRPVLVLLMIAQRWWS